jgi:hypothetical protein
MTARLSMKNRRRILLIASLPLAVGVIIGVLAMLPPRPGITMANFNRIRSGMTESDVEEIFGEEGVEMVYFIAGDEPQKDWIHWDATAKIGFLNGRVVAKVWMGDEPETLVEKMCRWLHLD